MNKIYYFLLVGTIIALSGCAERGVYQQYAQAVNSGNSSNALMMASYFENKNKLHAEVVKSLADSKNETAIVLYGIIASQGDKELLAMMQSQKIEAPTTNADIGVALVNNTIPSLAKYGAGAFLGAKMFDALKGTGTHISGDGNTITGNTGDAQTSALSPVTTTTTTTTHHSPPAE